MGLYSKAKDVRATSMSNAVFMALERYPIDYEFGLWDLKRDVFRLFPQSKYSHADTVSRRLREKRYGKGYQILCINPAQSRYKKVKVPPKRKKAV